MARLMGFPCSDICVLLRLFAAESRSVCAPMRASNGNRAELPSNGAKLAHASHAARGIMARWLLTEGLVMATDCYLILGVPRDASISRIRRAFMRFCHEHDPDRHLTEPLP